MKNTALQLIISLFLLTNCVPLKAQSYLPATITHQSGLKETGAVYLGNWIETPQSFRFKNAAGIEQKYGIKQLRSVEVMRKDGKTEYFECRIVMVNRSPAKLAELEVGAAPRMERDTVFLQTLLLSSVNLYLLKQHEVNHYFAEKDSLEELIFKQYLREPNDPALMKNNRFRQQLLALTLDCPFLRDRILKTNYEMKQIRELLLEYNKCNRTAVIYQYKHEKPGIGFYFGAGATVASLTNIETEVPLDPFEVVDKKPEVRFTPIAGFVFPISRTNERFSIKTDVSLRGIEYSYGYLPSPPDQDSVVETINLTHLRSHTLLQWNIFNRKHKIYILGGVHNSWLIGNENDLKFSSLFEASSLRKYDFGLVGGAGYGFGRFAFDIRYDRGRGYSTNESINTSIQTFSIFLTYRAF